MITGAAARLMRAWDDHLVGLPGSFGLVLRSGGLVVARDADARHYAASTIKLATLATLLTASPDSAAGGAVVAHDRFPSAVGGTFQLHREDDQDDYTWGRLGEPVALTALAERMIVDSSNIATDLLLERIGLAGVRRFLAGAGLDDRIEVCRMIGDSPAEAAGVTNTVTAAGLAALMAGIADASLLPADANAAALDLLAEQAHRRMIPAGLPAGTWSASKGGWVPGVKHDVALIRPAAAPPYVLAVCTTSDLADVAGEQLVARLSEVTWEHWAKWHE